MRIEKPLFGGRFKEISRNAIFPAGSKHYFGYANDGFSMHLVSPEGRTQSGSHPLCGSAYSVSHFMKPIRDGEIVVSAERLTLKFKVRTVDS